MKKIEELLDEQGRLFHNALWGEYETPEERSRATADNDEVARQIKSLLSQPPQEPPVDVRECVEALQKMAVAIKACHPNSAIFDLSHEQDLQVAIMLLSRLTLPVDDGLVSRLSKLKSLLAKNDERACNSEHQGTLDRAIAALRSLSERERGLRDALRKIAAMTPDTVPTRKPIEVAREALKEQP